MKHYPEPEGPIYDVVMAIVMFFVMLCTLVALAAAIYFAIDILGGAAL